jgi:uncharacterized protein
MPRKKTIPERINAKLKRLKQIIGQYKGVVIALSGGVDSSLLTFICHNELGDRALAVTAHSPVHSAEDLKLARLITSRIKIKHMIVKSHELSDDCFILNPADRCYTCKKIILRPISAIARKYGYQIIEASNIDDLQDYRPGFKALNESGVVSPFIKAGIGKKEIRSLARFYGLPNWDRPANACYATRIPFYQSIDLKKLKRIAAAENYLKKIFSGAVRLRDHDLVARIEADRKCLPTIIKNRRKILIFLKKIGYKYITLDLEGYRTGSLNP